VAAGEKDQQHLIDDRVLPDERVSHLGAQPADEGGGRIEIEWRCRHARRLIGHDARVVYHLRVAAPPLTPALLAALGDLDLAARTVVEGLRTGLHRSPFHGYSAEFSQYRHYRPGDDLRYVDWKLLARTDRLYTRQYRETTNLEATCLVDASASMGFADDGGPSKLAAAVLAASAFALLVSRQGDAIGLATTPAAGAPLPPRGGSLHLRRVLAALAGVAPKDRGDLATAVRRATDALPRRGLLLVFSDLYDDEARTAAELRRARLIGHDVAVFHVFTRSELEFPWRADAEFRDLESGERLASHAGDVRAAYHEAFSDFLERWRTRLQGDAIEYTRLMTHRPLDEPLRAFLLGRRSPR
jgi:uncharacterized protein (DUF58 family)